ncbi:MAG TPA: DUF58 domain-containing protein [Thermoleophilaceae bacterium]|nr:DUF58 domain-containing protein [Thermoleophilaceae bacterium]
MSATASIQLPAGRQGPGPTPSALVDALDLVVARRAGSRLPGERPAPGVGMGTELSQLRPYQPGDDVRQLDPAATARTGIPHVRLHVPERLLTTWLALDVSPSMAFGTADRLKADVAEGVVSVVGRLAIRRGGRVALLTSGGPSDRFLPPRSGRGALVRLARVLAEGVAADGAGDEAGLARTLARLGRIARQPGLVVVVSDFRGPRTWRRPLAALGNRHSLLAIEIRDPREASLPEVGHLALVDPETGRRVEVDSSDGRLRERYAAAERAEREAVAADLRRGRAEHVVLSTAGPWLKALGRSLR